MREGERGEVRLLGKAVILHHFLRVITDEYLSQNHYSWKQRGNLATRLIFTYPYFISSVFLLLITQISLAASQVTLHIFDTHLLRAFGVFAPTQGLGSAFIRCCASLRERCCFIEAHVNVHHMTEAMRIHRHTG